MVRERLKRAAPGVSSWAAAGLVFVTAWVGLWQTVPFIGEYVAWGIGIALGAAFMATIGERHIEPAVADAIGLEDAEGGA